MPMETFNTAVKYYKVNIHRWRVISQRLPGYFFGAPCRWGV